MLAIDYYRGLRAGNSLSDEDYEAYALGFEDALTAMLSDEVYYGEAVRASTSLFAAVTAAVTFVEEDETYA